MPDWLSGRRMAVTAASVWLIGVALALAGTLQSLHTSEFDGLNNLYQIPFAVPWFFLPIPALIHNYVLEAWIDAGWGCLNAILIYRWIVRRQPAARSN